MKRWLRKAWLLTAVPLVLICPTLWEISRAWRNLYVRKRTVEEWRAYWAWWRKQ